MKLCKSAFQPPRNMQDKFDIKLQTAVHDKKLVSRHSHANPTWRAATN